MLQSFTVRFEEEEWNITLRKITRRTTESSQVASTVDVKNHKLYWPLYKALLIKKKSDLSWELKHNLTLSPSLRCCAQLDRTSSIPQCYHAHRKVSFRLIHTSPRQYNLKQRTRIQETKTPQYCQKWLCSSTNISTDVKRGFPISSKGRNISKKRSLGKSCVKWLTAMQPPLKSTSDLDLIVISTLKGQQFYLLSLFIQNHHGHYTKHNPVVCSDHGHHKFLMPHTALHMWMLYFNATLPDYKKL